MTKKLIGLIIGIFSFSIVSASSATELKLATFEPPKAFIASKILAGWAKKVVLFQDPLEKELKHFKN